MPAESEGQNRADSFHSCVPTLGTAHLCDIRVSIDQSRTPAPTSGRKKPASHGFLQRSPDARQPAPVSCRNKQRATPASRGVAPRRLDARQPTSGLSLQQASARRSASRGATQRGGRGVKCPFPWRMCKGLGQLLPGPRAHTAHGCMLRPASTRRTASRGHHSRKEPAPQRHVNRQITDVPADGRTRPDAIGHALRITRTTSTLHRVTRTAGREPPHHAGKDDRDQHVPPM
jgi:hypothetical protein